MFAMSTNVNSSSPQESCQEVLQTLRSSNLIFMVQESPYSAYITIRKRFRKDAQQSSQETFRKVYEAEVLKQDLDNLKILYLQGICC